MGLQAMNIINGFCQIAVALKTQKRINGKIFENRPKHTHIFSVTINPFFFLFINLIKNNVSICLKGLTF